MAVLDLEGARQMLIPRAELRDSGVGDRELRRALATGDFVRVRRGWYVQGNEWTELWPEGRHLLLIAAVLDDCRGEASPVLCGASAAVILGIPLYRGAPTRVHVACRRGESRSAPDVLRHEMALADGDVIEVSGARCTSWDRTALDLACTLSPEAAIAAADAALAHFAVEGHVQDAEKAEEWRRRLGDRAALHRGPGARQSRRVIDFADGRAQLPGESVSRLQLARLGFTRIDLQVHVLLPGGDSCWIDFDIEEAAAFGEFDGETKYLDPTLRGGRSVEQVLLDEKQREDLIRGVTGRRFVRWRSKHIATARDLGRHLAGFGIHPPR